MSAVEAYLNLLEMQMGEPDHIDRIEGVIEELKKITVMLEHIANLSNRVRVLQSSTDQREYRSGQWVKRRGNVYHRVALTGSPNAEKEISPAQHQGGDLPSVK